MTDWKGRIRTVSGWLVAIAAVVAAIHYIFLKPVDVAAHPVTRSTVSPTRHRLPAPRRGKTL